MTDDEQKVQYEALWDQVIAGLTKGSKENQQKYYNSLKMGDDGSGQSDAHNKLHHPGLRNLMLMNNGQGGLEALQKQLNDTAGREAFKTQAATQSDALIKEDNNPKHLTPEANLQALKREVDAANKLNAAVNLTAAPKSDAPALGTPALAGQFTMTAVGPEGLTSTFNLTPNASGVFSTDVHIRPNDSIRFDGPAMHFGVIADAGTLAASAKSPSAVLAVGLVNQITATVKEGRHGLFISNDTFKQLEEQLQPSLGQSAGGQSDPTAQMLEDDMKSFHKNLKKLDEQLKKLEKHGDPQAIAAKNTEIKELQKTAAKEFQGILDGDKNLVSLLQGSPQAPKDRTISFVPTAEQAKLQGPIGKPVAPSGVETLSSTSTNPALDVVAVAADAARNAAALGVGGPSPGPK